MVFRIDPNRKQDRELLERVLGKQAVPPLKKRPKYWNRKSVDEEGNKWDSDWELTCWKVFKSLQRRGLIFHLDRQVPFEFSGNGEDGSTIIIGTYIADFVFCLTPDGPQQVADAKSPRTASTQSWRRTVKLMKLLHNKVVHVLVDTKTDPEKLVVHLRAIMVG